MGAHAASGVRFFTPLRIVLLVGTVVFWLGFLRTYPCMSNGWLDPDRYEAMCYSDVPILYQLRGLADGIFPYLSWPPTDQPVEYPVLIGVWMWLLAKITTLVNGGSDPLVYYVVNAVGAFAAYLVALAATAQTVKGRTWDGLMMALSPAVFLAAFINWDWPAIALTALALLAWSRSLPTWAGVLLGLAIAAKFYPILLLGPLVLLCLRRRQYIPMGKLLLATVATWLVVNIPFMIAGFDGWKYFFTFSSERGQDFGSVWLALEDAGYGVDPVALNRYAMGSLLVLCAGIAALVLFAKHPPRVAQVSFLVVAAFLLTNKVYSPQFVLWLLPLAILARPRWRDVVWWQIAEAVYFGAIWWYLAGLGENGKGLSEQWYAGAIAVHLLATAAFAALVVRDILMPQHDPVRSDGWPSHMDDPGGGVLNTVAALNPPTPEFPLGKEEVHPHGDSLGRSARHDLPS